MLSVIVTWLMPRSHFIILEPYSPIVTKSTYFDGNYDVTSVTLNSVDDTMGPIRSVYYFMENYYFSTYFIPLLLYLICLKISLSYSCILSCVSLIVFSQVACFSYGFFIRGTLVLK